jgi:hypothetical protein
MIIWISVTVVLCLVSFSIGKLSHPRQTYDAAPLADDMMNDRAVLTILRAGNSTNAIQSLENMLDLAISDAMSHRFEVRNKDRKMLNRVLFYIASYREQFPRPIATTNGFSLDPDLLQRFEKGIAQQEQIDAFLSSFVETNTP